MPPEVKLVTTQTVSFWVLKSPLARQSMVGSRRLASMTYWIWVGVPAVMLESVQAASFWMECFSWERSFGKAGGGGLGENSSKKKFFKKKFSKNYSRPQ